VRLKQSLEERQARRLIVESVVRRGASLTEEMRSQLYILQMQLLGLLKERLHTPVESHDQKAVEKIKELRKLAFDPRAESSSSSLHLASHHGHKRFGDDYRKLGFRNEIDPTQDFRETPPGMLALDMMYAFACTHTEQYTKIVLENTREGYECPFAQTAIEILRMMWEVINSESTVFCPVFLAHEQPLEVNNFGNSSKCGRLSHSLVSGTFRSDDSAHLPSKSYSRLDLIHCIFTLKIILFRHFAKCEQRVKTSGR
jgi:hypothetical protein